MSEADPRIVALEKQFSQLHVQLFDTFSHAQSAVMTVMQTGRDIDENQDDFTQLKRDFEVAVAMYPGNDQTMQQKITATNELAASQQTSNVHLTQVWAAAVSALSCDRMLAMIPGDLQDDPDMAGELKQKRREHLAMWQERLENT